MNSLDNFKNTIGIFLTLFIIVVIAFSIYSLKKESKEENETKYNIEMRAQLNDIKTTS